MNKNFTQLTTQCYHSKAEIFCQLAFLDVPAPVAFYANYLNLEWLLKCVIKGKVVRNQSFYRDSKPGAINYNAVILANMPQKGS